MDKKQIIIQGYSDDIISISGAINEEIEAYESLFAFVIAGAKILYWWDGSKGHWRAKVLNHPPEIDIQVAQDKDNEDTTVVSIQGKNDILTIAAFNEEKTTSLYFTNVTEDEMRKQFSDQSMLYQNLMNIEWTGSDDTLKDIGMADAVRACILYHHLKK